MFDRDWDSIGITDNLMFGTVFRDATLCRDLLEAILDMHIEHVEFAERERSVAVDVRARSIRLDVFAADGSGRVYNVEMENFRHGDLMKRSRYYQSQISLDCLKPGEPYAAMRDAFVIFVCGFDPFGSGKRRYTVTPHVRETGSEVPDGATRVFVSTVPARSPQDEPGGRLSAFLDYARGDNGGMGNEFVQRVDTEVRRVRASDEWRHERMTFDMYLAEERYYARQEARAEALAEGKAEGLAEGKAEGLAEGLEQGKAEGLAEGLEQGRERERARAADLARALSEAGRAGEIAQALADEGRYRGLLEEFGIA